MYCRSFLALAGAALAVSAAVSSDVAQGAAFWWERPVKIVVPFAPGGATDQTARVWADKLTSAFKKQFVHDKMEEIGATEDMATNMIAVNMIVPKQTVGDMRQFLIDDIARNRSVIEKNNIKVD